MYQLIIRSDLDIHLKKDHNPDKEENNVIGIGSSEPEEEEEARPFAGVKVKKAEKSLRGDNGTTLANHAKVRIKKAIADIQGDTSGCDEPPVDIIHSVYIIRDTSIRDKLGD